MRYFFNVRSGARSIRDNEGAEFPTQQAARAEAFLVARELVGRSLFTGVEVDWLGAIDIATEDQVVDTVSFLVAVGIPQADRNS